MSATISNFARSLYAQIAMQLTVFIRNMRSVFFTVAFPIMMIVLFASGSSGQANIPAQQGINVTMASWTIVGLCCYTLLMGTFVRVAGDMAAQRSTSLLKRLRLRSTSDAAVIAGYIVTASIIALACTLILIVFGMAVYHLPMPKNIPLTILVILLTTVVLSLIGAAYASFIPSAEATQIMLLPPALVLMFLSGIFQPVWTIPAGLRDFAGWFPLVHLTDALRSAWFGLDVAHAQVSDTGLTIPSGTQFISTQGMLVIGLWCAVSLIFAITKFRWDPRQH